MSQCEFGLLTKNGVPTPTGDVCAVCFSEATEKVVHWSGQYELCSPHAEQVYQVMALAGTLAGSGET